MGQGIQPDDDRVLDGLGPRGEFPEIIKRVASRIIRDVLEDFPVLIVLLLLDVDLQELVGRAGGLRTTRSAMRKDDSRQPRR
jgi:hypothetical protein